MSEGARAGEHIFGALGGVLLLPEVEVEDEGVDLHHIRLAARATIAEVGGAERRAVLLVAEVVGFQEVAPRRLHAVGRAVVRAVLEENGADREVKGVNRWGG